MRLPIMAAVGVTSLAALGAYTQVGGPGQQQRVPHTVTVNVTCPAPGGNQRDAVTPWEAQLQVGDTLEWNLAEPVLSDTLDISLKQAGRRWPFANQARARGRRRARGHQARDRGRYDYNILLRCPAPGGRSRLITIDPDFIINE
jgi:hypothetical protein